MALNHPHQPAVAPHLLSHRDRNLWLTSALNLLITVVELIGGIFSGSLALISDSLHNAGDTLAVLLSYIAIRIGTRKANQQKTFGYKRAEILTALVNAMLLIAVSVFLMGEAVRRLQHPKVIEGNLMLIVAVTGLLANLAGMLLLRPHQGKSLNIRAAWLHLMGDTISSLAVIAGALAIVGWNLHWIDPIITFGVALYLIKESWNIITESAHILMQGAPHGVDVAELIRSVKALPLVDNIHHIHLWSLDDRTVHLEAHVQLTLDIPLSEADVLRTSIENRIADEFGVNHITLQLEYADCGNKRIE